MKPRMKNKDTRAPHTMPVAPKALNHKHAPALHLLPARYPSLPLFSPPNLSLLHKWGLELRYDAPCWLSICAYKLT